MANTLQSIRNFVRIQPQQKDSMPETSAGGPTYDARIDPAINAQEIVGNERLARARDLHLFYEKTAPAQDFSHFVESQPSPLAAQMMGLAASRDAIERIVSRKDLPPFPGVELGHVPSVAPSPSTNPVIGSPFHLTHHAHQVESKRATRARFGH